MAIRQGGIEVTGLKEFRRGLKRIDAQLPKDLRLELKAVGTTLAHEVAGKVPHQSGKAAGSVKAGVSGNNAYLQAGGKKAPYYGWLDFGGGIPNKAHRGNNPPRISRPFVKRGRFIFPTIDAHRAEITRAALGAFNRLARRAF